ncbi:hypothetical protein SeMB42_g06598 [Synchytrium endobioticum]|uniref:Calponin-homology (CH) domain-containing protein n=1 Tax=Synchytrium endobioticum TaxID=286115 RepID=A0A507CGQ1_9FUNG|nr:hypothetical protein SeMB42_g06598 [Synchytrium endobioticum]TPX41891.1 hypothetical protein SeLEV6574_g05870 [Synchytrium endobioticum]
MPRIEPCIASLWHSRLWPSTIFSGMALEPRFYLIRDRSAPQLPAELSRVVPNRSLQKPHIPNIAPDNRPHSVANPLILSSLRRIQTSVSMMGESRTELLTWLNDLLQLGYTKIEQCGTGAAHCQILDSIFKDVPISKVKFNTRQEYEYIHNFKILQNAFDKHKIDNAIPVERLVKCKFQDNIEFLQWMKKYWDQYYPGGSYDALARRKTAGIDGSASSTNAASAGPTRTNMATFRTATAAAPTNGIKKSISNSSVEVRTTLSKPIAKTIVAPRAMGNTGGNNANGGLSGRERAELEADYQRTVNDLTQQALELKLNVEQVEKERDFYFGKLREIEIFVQQLLEAETAGSEIEAKLKEIQGIMYKTEDGFEIPEGGEPEIESF